MKQDIVKIDDENLKNSENFCCVCLIGVIIVINRIEQLYTVHSTVMLQGANLKRDTSILIDR